MGRTAFRRSLPWLRRCASEIVFHQPSDGAASCRTVANGRQEACPDATQMSLFGLRDVLDVRETGPDDA